MYTVLPRILCVDDEPHVLDAMARTLRRHFDVTTATGGEQGLDLVEREGPFAVVISDQRMPVVDGVSFLARVREAAPDTVRVLLTGYADTTAAMGAVNRGAVFRFLSKPIETPELLQTLNAAVEQHRVMAAERLLLERTLYGSIKAIIDVLALVNPQGFGRAQRARETVVQLCTATNVPNPWQYEVAAMISQVGSMAMGSALGKPEKGGYDRVEQAAVGQLSRIAADMVANIPRLEEVHAMLSHQDLRYDGSNATGRGPRERSIPLGARMLKLAFDLDVLEAEGTPRGSALETLRDRWGWYDPQLLDALRGAGKPATPMLSGHLTTAMASGDPTSTMISGRPTTQPMPGGPATPMIAGVAAAPRRPAGASEEMIPAAPASPMLSPTAPPATPDPRPAISEIELRLLQPGMVLGEEVRTRGGRLLIARGEAATSTNIRQVKGTLDFNELRQSVRVQIPPPPAPPPPPPRMRPVPPSPPTRSAVSAGGMELDLTMRLTV